MASLDPLINAPWLAANIDRPDIKILDGTWIMPGETPSLPKGYISGAQFFDIDIIADLTSPMKHMLPSAATFEAAVSKMGIKADDHVIIYDRHGFRTAPRLWWTFRMFGHENVAILDGGLPAWITAGYGISDSLRLATPSKYTSRAPLAKVVSQKEILNRLDQNVQILDARPEGRFYGTEPEPRAGLRSGHIPKSKSWPFSNIVAAGKLRSLTDIKNQIKAENIDLSKPIITSCGSGITAAGLAFALHLLGAEDVSLYDGSWTEWGASTLPISSGD